MSKIEIQGLGTQLRFGYPLALLGHSLRSAVTTFRPRILTHRRKSIMKGNMKKLKNIHPLKEIVVQGQCITGGFMLTISHIGAASPVTFVSAAVEVPRPEVVRQGNPSSRKRYTVTGYRGKFTPKKGKRK